MRQVTKMGLFGHSKLDFSFQSTARPCKLAARFVYYPCVLVLLLCNETDSTTCSSPVEELYGGPEGCPSRTFPRESSTHRRPSRTFSHERQFFSSSPFTNVLSRTFSRERFLANVFSTVTLCEQSLTNTLSIAESSWLAASVES